MFQLHLVALSALRRDLVELSDRLQHMTAEKDAADKLIARLQVSVFVVVVVVVVVVVDQVFNKFTQQHKWIGQRT